MVSTQLLRGSCVCVSTFSLLFSLFAPIRADAQTAANTGFELRNFAITNARLVVAPGQEIEKGTIVLRGGLIEAVGADLTPPPNVEIIDGTGLVVHAGFIDAANSAAVDKEKIIPQPGRNIDYSRFALAGTAIDNRKNLTPEFEPHTGLKSDFADRTESRRASGFTDMLVVPSQRGVGGQGELFSLSGAPVRESLGATKILLQVHLVAPGGGAYPSTMMGIFAHLRQAYLDAQRYALQKQLYAGQTPGVERPAEDLVLESLAEGIQRKQPLLLRAEHREDIRRSIGFAVEHGLPAILWGGAEGFECLDLLKEHTVPVIATVDWGDEPKFDVQGKSKGSGKDDSKPESKLNPVLPAPTRVQKSIRERFQSRIKNLADLHAAGIKVAISTEGLGEIREVHKSLRAAIQAGLPRDAALAALTTVPAEIFGQSARLGTLAPGKLAHVTVLNGPFDDERTVVRYVFIDGMRFEFNKDSKPVSGPTPGTPDLAGVWNLDIETGDGKSTAKLELTQTGDRITGSFSSKQAEGRITSAKASASEIALTVSIGAGAQTIELKFAATPDAANPNTLTGTLKSAFGSPTKWTAQRESPPKTETKTPDAKNPVQLSLDASGSESSKPESKTQDAIASSEADKIPSELELDRKQRHITTGGNLLIKNGTVWTGFGEPQANTSVLIKAGKFAAIGPDLPEEPGVTVIDAAGRFVIPGLIDTHCHMLFADNLGGVNEATLSIVPEVRVRDVLTSDDANEYRALAGGTICARLLHGSANVIGGQDAVVKFKYGEPVSKHLLTENPIGVKFALGENVKFRRGRFPNTRLGVEAVLARAFVEALDYRRQWMEYNRAKDADPNGNLLPPRRDLRLEALADILSATKFIHCHSYRSDEILMLLRIANLNGIRVQSLQHVLEGYKVAPEIVAHGASCSTFSDWWAYKVEAYDATPYNAALLQEAGANVVLKSDDRELIRHMQLEAAKTVRYGGMTPEQALRTVTLNSARELGLDSRMGSIEVGKDGDVAIFSGHPFSAFSRCEYSIIDGEVYFVREKQPSAMSPAAAAASATPRPLVFPAPEVRAKKLAIPAAANYAIVNATVHPVDGADIEAATVLVQGDNIAAIGRELPIPPEFTVVDASGLHVYPGLIDSGTILGLTEIEKVVETQDFSETGPYHPDLRAGVAVNPESELIPVARAGGVTLAFIRPMDGVISGQCSLMKLAGWTTPEMVLNFEAGLQINLPGVTAELSDPIEPTLRLRSPREERQNERQKEVEKELERLREFLALGRAYDKLKQQAAAAGVTPPLADPRFEALVPYLRGEKRVFMEANSRQAIIEALEFAEKENLKIVITGGRDAWKAAAELKERSVPVVMGPVMQAPGSNFDPFDAPYACPGRLHEAGVLFAIRSNEASNSRNVALEAGVSVAYGLPEVEALKAITLNAARLLQVDDRYGSITPGKKANLVICDGSPLQHTTQYKAIFIHGKPFAPESRQTRLYEKYRERLLQTKAVTDGAPAN